MRLAATSGVPLEIECSLRWAEDLIAEATADLPAIPDDVGRPLRLRVSADRRPSEDLDGGWVVLSRRAWTRDGEVAIRDVCSSGFDLRLGFRDGPHMDLRWRPPARSRAAAKLLRSRFRLLARAALVQYPSLWWASTRGCTPIHAAVVTAGGATVLLAGPSGVGKSTLVERELEAGGHAVSDNVCVTDGRTAWGLVEPIRGEGTSGPRAPHGRRERPMPRRVFSLTPDIVVVLRRGTGDAIRARRIDADEASRQLVAGTYMAGELRRYWPLAATLAIGSGLGPVHPAIAATVQTLTERVPCFEVALNDIRGVRLADALEECLTA
jgi:hypothetical protein